MPVLLCFEMFLESLHLIKSPWPTVSVIISLLLVVAIFIPVTSLIGMLGIWAERRISARIQSRLGPNRVGYFGLLQSLADGIKVISKEDLIPDGADHWLFRVAPYLAFVPVFAAYAALPFGPEFTFEPRLSAGVFWLLAILSVEVIGVILAGWASNNKWSMYGAMREACQMVCYEIPLGIAIIIGVMTAGTLNLVELGNLQSGGIHTWIIFRNPFVLAAFIVYFVASLAATKRAPFDLPESESELVAGYHTEYSGMRFTLFFFAEYAGMFVVAGIQSALFLGGWNDPFGWIGYQHHRIVSDMGDPHRAMLMGLNFLAAGIFTFKCVLLMLVQMWVRWTFPRPRIDQVLYVCVKVLLPLACILLLGAALWQLFIPERAGIPWQDYQPWQMSDWMQRGVGAAWITQVVLAAVAMGFLTSILGWIGYAFATGRKDHQRLSEPELF
jgi:NADH-quinone oxidoreductase subunit H